MSKEREVTEKRPVHYRGGLFEDAGVVSTMGELLSQWSTCKRCELCKRRKSVVIGGGFRTTPTGGTERCHNEEEAAMLVVGPYPGRREDEIGWPVVGREGIKSRAWVSWPHPRHRGVYQGVHPNLVYWTNILGCWPKEREFVRDDWLVKCRPRLRSIIRIVKPKLIVAMGQLTAQFMLGVKMSVDALSRCVHSYDATPLVVTMHPARLARIQASQTPTQFKDKERQMKKDIQFAFDVFSEVMDEHR
jgi:DNA polymerase